jgi:hypothetical protein
MTETKYIYKSTETGYTVFADTLPNYQPARLTAWLKDHDFKRAERVTDGWVHDVGDTAKFIKRFERGQNRNYLQVTVKN